ncbi:hypothetical protein AUG19_09305 [archaeon 13_1_20CM_2_54_9]|nr:MAG: hypothetical protein AUJ07_08435 [Crenarchaeota archaeon 13_1_40CM_3_53_5]OLE74302.1 MAG: hypothetical protein AUG19_09305 [archaeon 13_1_20CM_2_54_9]
MKTNETYTKKITSEEGREGYFLVFKNRLSFFPAAGKTFHLVKDGHSRKARVESYPCTCRGPSEPHDHFFVRTRGLKAGDRVAVSRDSGKTARFVLHVHRNIQHSQLS